MNLLADLNNQVEDLQDLNDTTAFSQAERKVLPAGTALAIFTSYIEVGIQNNRPIQGKPRDPTNQCYIGFHIVGGTYAAADGTRQPYCAEGKAIPIRSNFPLDIKHNEKAKYIKVFEALNYKKTARHFVELLSKAYFVKIEVDTKDGKEYNSYDFRECQAPVKDVMAGTFYEANDPSLVQLDESVYRAFLWDKPTKAQWDSIYVDGTYKDKDGTEHSKNKMQELIMTANNYVGSPIENLLMGGESLPNLEVPANDSIPDPDL